MTKYKTLKGIANGTRATLKRNEIRVSDTNNRFKFTEGLLVEVGYSKVVVQIIGEHTNGHSLESIKGLLVEQGMKAEIKNRDRFGEPHSEIHIVL